jgi:hypothetical protein
VKQFFIINEQNRDRIANVVRVTPDGMCVTIREASKTRDQEAKYHAMCGDIAKCCEFMGEKVEGEDWKRLLIDAFARVKASMGEPLKQGGRIVPSLDGTGIVQLGIQSRKFTKKEASEFIEYLYAYGAERDVKWSA